MQICAYVYQTCKRPNQSLSPSLEVKSPWDVPVIIQILPAEAARNIKKSLKLSVCWKKTEEKKTEPNCSGLRCFIWVWYCSYEPASIALNNSIVLSEDCFVSSFCEKWNICVEITMFWSVSKNVRLVYSAFRQDLKVL